MSPGRIDDDYIGVRELLHPVLDDGNTVARLGVPVNLYLDLLRKLGKLIEGGGPVNVSCDEPDLEPPLLEVLRHLGGGCGLTLAVQADHHDHMFVQAHVPPLAEDIDQLLVDDPYDVLSGAHPCWWSLLKGPPLQLLGDLEDQANVDVRLEQGPLDVPDHLLDDLLVDIGGVCDLLERPPEGFA